MVYAVRRAARVDVVSLLLGGISGFQIYKIAQDAMQSLCVYSNPSTLPRVLAIVYNCYVEIALGGLSVFF